MERKIDRFDRYMKSKGLNDNKVTNLLGLSVGTLGKSRKPQRDLSDKSVEQILKFYTDLNRVWLMTGEGEMLYTPTIETQGSKQETENETTAKLVNIFPVEAQAGSLKDFFESVREWNCEKIISPVRDVDFALGVAGDSMSPEYPNGSRIFVKQINERAFIEWGRVFVLDTCNGIVIKRLVPSEKDGYVKCLSINTDPIYAPFEVAWSDVYGVYRVVVCMSTK